VKARTKIFSLIESDTKILNTASAEQIFAIKSKDREMVAAIRSTKGFLLLVKREIKLIRMRNGKKMKVVNQRIVSPKEGIGMEPRSCIKVF